MGRYYNNGRRSVADPGFTEGGFKTVMCAMRVREKI